MIEFCDLMRTGTETRYLDTDMHHPCLFPCGLPTTYRILPAMRVLPELSWYQSHILKTQKVWDKSLCKVSLPKAFCYSNDKPANTMFMYIYTQHIYTCAHICTCISTYINGSKHGVAYPLVSQVRQMNHYLVVAASVTGKVIPTNLFGPKQPQPYKTDRRCYLI